MAMFQGIDSGPFEEKWAAEGRHCLCFRRDMVIANQLRIPIAKVPNDIKELYLILVEGGTDTVYSLSFAEWHSLRIVDRLYRVGHLSKLRCVTAQTHEETGPVIPNVVHFTELHATHHLDLLWPHQIVNLSLLDCQSQSQLVAFAGALFDFILLDRVLAQKKSERLIGKWFRQLEDCHDFASASFHFLASLVSLTPSDQSTLQYDHVKWHLMTEWLDFQIFLFVRQGRKELAEIHASLLDHVRWLDNEAYHGWHHVWSGYALPNRVNCFWQEENGQVTTHPLWFLQCKVPLTLVSVQHGIVSMRSHDFVRYILPTIYRQVLHDLAHHLIHLTLYPCESRLLDFHVDRHLASLLRDVHTTDDMHKFNLAIAENHNSRIMRLMVRHDCEQDVIKSQTRLNTGIARSQISQLVPDIEDLVTFMPPCLAPVFKQNWCKHEDRWHAVRYLYDMRYSEEQTVNYMARKRKDSTNDVNIIRGLYKGCQKKAEERSSFYCSSLSNVIFQPGNIMRCPYEAAKNGTTRRKNHTPDEQGVFTAQCAHASNCSSIRHPLDYVVNKLSNLVYFLSY